jgi:vitamin B12 transporter
MHDVQRRAWRKLALACGAAALALSAQAAHAAEAASVSEVVVTGDLEQTLPQAIAKSGSRLTVITSEQIEAGNYLDVGQALNLVPGLSLIPQSGPFSYNTASLQGSRPSEIVYLIDGVRISNRLYNTTPPLDTIPAHMVDRIEMLEGGQSLFFGTQAVAGAINIVTRPFTDQLTGRLQAGVNTNRGITFNGYASGAAAGNRFVVYASHDEARGYQPFPDADYQPSGTDHHRGYRLDSVGAKYAYDFTDDLRFSASYEHIEGFVDFILPVRAAKAVNRRNEEIATAKLDWTVNDQFQVFVKGYWHDWDSHYDEVDNVPGGGFDHVDENEFWGFFDYGVNAVGKFTPTAGLETYLGYDLQIYGGRDDVLLIADRKEKTQAVFGQIVVTPELLARTHLALGVRYNHPDVGSSATVWNLSGLFDLTDTFFIRGNAGTAFRLPDAESLFAIDPINNGEIGNPNLKPETSQNFNASIGGHGQGWSLELIGFARDTKNLIDLSGETPDPDVFTFINLPGKVKARGFEVVGNVDVSPSLSLQGSYTHARTKPEGTDLQLAQVPKDTAQGVVSFHPEGRPFGGDLIGNYVGSVVDNVSSGFGRRQRGHYAVIDLNTYLTFGPGDRQRLSARLENVFDEDYSTRTSRATRDAGGAYLTHYRGVPRTLHVAYTYSF